MQIAECPQCGHPIDSANTSEQQRLIFAAGALVATCGLIGMLMDSPDYEIASAGFQARLKEVTEYVERQTEEIAAWGEIYDDETPEAPEV